MPFDGDYIPYKGKYNRKLKLKIKTEEIFMNNKNVGISFDIIGIGHAGSKIAEQFFKLGYKTFVINTSPQDLALINGPTKLAISSSGAGKDREKAKDLLERSKEVVIRSILSIFPANKEHVILIAGLGGGTGSGTIIKIAEYLKEVNYKNITVLIVLPLKKEDPTSKKNTLKALKEIGLATATNTITSIIIADNSLIHKLYPNLSITDFWTKANEEIVKPIHAFNSMCTMPTNFIALDPQEFRNLITTKGCITFGKSNLKFYDDETIVTTIEKHFDSGLMAKGFSYYDAIAEGIIILGNPTELSKIPKKQEELIFSQFINYINGGTQYKGVYSSEEYPLMIYSMITGLGIPYEKVEDLKKECKQQDQIKSNKEFKINTSAFDE